MGKKPTKTLCILGCGGFIGSHILERILSETDWFVYGIDKNSSKIAALLDNPRLSFVERHIDSADAVEDYLQKSDVVVSLVALCNPSLYNTIPIEVIKSNFVRPLSIVERCSKLGKWLVHFSTCEVYGTTVSHNAGAAFNGVTDIFKEDETPLIMGPVRSQRWSYACAKQLLERFIFAHGFENRLPYTIIRPFNFIGPRMDFLPGIDGEGVPRVIACFMDALLSNKPLKLVDGGTNRRTFTYIDDAVDAVMAVLARPQRAIGHIFNIGNPANETTIAELAAAMIDLYKKIRPDAAGCSFTMENVGSRDFYGEGYEDSDRRIPDIAKARRLLSWTPKIPLEKALRQTISSYIREYGNRQACREAV
jgi:UDP-apiose/xylose synthase